MEIKLTIDGTEYDVIQKQAEVSQPETSETAPAPASEDAPAQ